MGSLGGDYVRDMELVRTLLIYMAAKGGPNRHVSQPSFEEYPARLVSRAKRMATGTFRKPGISVSRLAISSRAQIETNFVEDLHSPANNLQGVMPISIRRLVYLGKAHPRPLQISVVQKPEKY